MGKALSRTMTSSRPFVGMAARIALVIAVFAGPVQAYAMMKAEDGASARGAGLVLLVSLQRAG